MDVKGCHLHHRRTIGITNDCLSVLENSKSTHRGSRHRQQNTPLVGKKDLSKRFPDMKEIIDPEENLRKSRSTSLDPRYSIDCHKGAVSPAQRQEKARYNRRRLDSGKENKPQRTEKTEKGIRRRKSMTVAKMQGKKSLRNVSRQSDVSFLTNDYPIAEISGENAVSVPTFDVSPLVL